jgi:hypothetical protein
MIQQLSNKIENVIKAKYNEGDPALINEKLGMIVSKVTEVLKPFNIHEIDDWNITPLSNEEYPLMPVEQDALCSIYLINGNILLKLILILSFYDPKMHISEVLTGPRHILKNIHDLHINIKQIIINKDLKPIAVNGIYVVLKYFNERYPDVLAFDSQESAIKFQMKLTEIRANRKSE